jgi:AcrR family transcriptional regulator
MLKGEGLKSVSVRKIADRAGYSYATMYNYFKDVQELIFLCVKDFQEECRELVESGTKHSTPGPESIKAKAGLYIRYFVEYPGIFELFFLEKMTDIEIKQPVSTLIYTFLNRLCQKDWDYCIAKGIYDEDEARERQTELNYMITGLLLHYINRRQPVAYAEFSAIAKSQVARIMR